MKKREIQKEKYRRRYEGRRKTQVKSNPWSRLAKYLIWMVIFLTLCLTAIIIGGILTYRHYGKDLPEISSLKKYEPPLVTTVYSGDGTKIAEFYKERRIPVTIEEMPRNLIHAFVAAEDSRFFEHQGLDFIGIVRAAIKNIQAGAVVQGGSTITQQVVKRFLLSPERSYERKLKEAILAYRIDKNFSKDEILYLYLNQIYLGHGAYGVGAAAENYFGKKVSELNLAECAMLAGLPQAPSEYSPYKHFVMAKKRQIYVLNRMVIDGYIDPAEAEVAKMAKIEIKERKNLFINKAPNYTEHIRREVEKMLGKKLLYTGGLKIYTCVDLAMQAAARKAIDKGLRELDKRQGYRGPVRHLTQEEIEPFCSNIQNQMASDPPEPGKIEKGVVIRVDDQKKSVTVRIGKHIGRIPMSKMKWARKPDFKVEYKRAYIKKPSEALAEGDVVLVKILEMTDGKIPWKLGLEQDPVAQSALLCIETGTGHVKAMVGGRDFRNSQFNRVIQARRQPGSAFKPIFYAAALDKGYTPASEIIDNAIVFEDVERDLKWKPRSYDRKFHGPTRLRVALAHSRNLASIKILKDIGIDYAIQYARKLGIESHLSNDLSIALGSSGVSPFELVRAYSIFANKGQRIEPVFIEKIIDRNGKELYHSETKPEQVIEKTTAFLMTSLLQSVVKEGTGRKVQVLGRPVAGKTGTTNNLNDAWFVGFTPEFVTGAWVGFDQAKTLGVRETGARAAAPIWIEFMKTIMKDRPVQDFEEPEGIITCLIDAKTGLLPIPESKNVIAEKFKEGTQPKEYTKKALPILEKEISDAMELSKTGEAFPESPLEMTTRMSKIEKMPKTDMSSFRTTPITSENILGKDDGGMFSSRKTEKRHTGNPDGFELKSIRFFETMGETPSFEDIRYKKIFSKDSVSNVNAEVVVNNLYFRNREQEHVVVWILRGPNGDIRNRVQKKFMIKLNWRLATIRTELFPTSLKTSVEKGTYRVSILFDGRFVGERRFQID